MPKRRLRELEEVSEEYKINRDRDLGTWFENQIQFLSPLAGLNIVSTYPGKDIVLLDFQCSLYGELSYPGTGNAIDWTQVPIRIVCVVDNFAKKTATGNLFTQRDLMIENLFVPGTGDVEEYLPSTPFRADAFTSGEFTLLYDRTMVSLPKYAGTGSVSIFQHQFTVNVNDYVVGNDNAALYNDTTVNEVYVNANSGVPHVFVIIPSFNLDPGSYGPDVSGWFQAQFVSRLIPTT